MTEFNAQKVSKVSKRAAADPDASFSVEGINDGTFAIASSKKELKQLMNSDADVVYDDRKGKLYFNENCTKSKPKASCTFLYTPLGGSRSQ